MNFFKGAKYALGAFLTYKIGKKLLKPPPPNQNSLIAKQKLTYLPKPSDIRQDVSYKLIQTSDKIGGNLIKVVEKLSQVIDDDILPYVEFKFGRSGNPEVRKKKPDYRSPSILMFPIYASDDEEEIKELEGIFSNKYKTYCANSDNKCIVRNINDGSAGPDMTPRNDKWFFLYVVVYL